MRQGSSGLKKSFKKLAMAATALVCFGCSKALLSVTSFGSNKGLQNFYYQCPSLFFLQGSSNFSYSPQNVPQGAQFSVSPSLTPLGLQLDPNTGTISGATNSASLTSTPITVTMNFSGGTQTQFLNLTTGPGYSITDVPSIYTTMVSVNSGTNLMVYFPTGTYNLTGPINVTAPAIFFGECKAPAPTAILDGQSSYQIFNVTGGNTSFYNLAMQNGLASNGGAIGFFPSVAGQNLILQNIVFYHNTTSGKGGAVYSNGGTYQPVFNFYNITFNSNTASVDGGAVYLSTAATSNNLSTSNFISNSSARGGAVTLSSTGGIALTGDLFQNNMATSTGGGAIYTNVTGAGAVTISNSTFTGNSSTSYGGALYSQASGVVSVAYNTFKNNSAANLSGGGAEYIGSSSPLTNIGDIFVGNLANSVLDSCDKAGAPYNFGSYNIVDDGADICGNGNATDVISTVTALGPLQLNYGFTSSFMPLPGSKAIDFIPMMSCPPQDQRGWLRGQDGDGHCEAGSVEYSP